MTWTGYLKPTFTENFIFTVRSNDGVKLTIGDKVVINKLDANIASGSSLTSTSDPVSLTAGSFVPIKVEYYEITGEAFIILEWQSTSQSQSVIPAAQFFSPSTSAVPVTGSAVTASSIYSPMKVSSVSQGDSSTYANNALTLTWKAPTDFGCDAVTNYKITLDDGSSPSTTTVGAVTTATISSLTPGQAYTVTIQAVNSVGDGVGSDPVTLTPATLPTAPSPITVSLYEQNALTLTWPVPTDTGIGDTSVAITSYLLEVDEGYGKGFVKLVEQTSRTFKHSNLVAGHKLKYRVSARNFLGYGPTSSEFSFSPIVKPSKPSKPPRNVPTLTDRSVIHIEYDEVENNGGSAILNYNIYIDDGQDGAFGLPINNGLSLTFDTSSLTLTTGWVYNLKYSAVNSQGESELSDEVSILLAEIPGVPQNFVRKDITTLSAGMIRVSWEAPIDNGGTEITGYNLYQNGKLIYQASNTEYTYTLYDLNIGSTYTVAVSAVNAIGEGTKSQANMIAASVPAKMTRPTLEASSQTNIKVMWAAPAFDGGDPVTEYRIRRDNGPSTSFQSYITTTNLFYDFTGLSNSILTYRIQVAAVNSIGAGEYSTAYEFYAASPPSAPATFTVVSQSTSQISLAWTAPASNGGCSIEGYRLWMEDITKPGFKLIYDGSKNSSVLRYSVIAPTISASKTYKFQVAAIACRMTSSTTNLTVKSGSVPSKLPQAPVVSSYLTPDSVIVSFVPPRSNGGYTITNFKVYVDNALAQTLPPHGPHEFTLSSLTIGTSYKVQVSSTNSIGESVKSDSLRFTFVISAPPQNVALTSTQTQINLTWKPPSSANGDVVNGYRIYVNDGVGSDPVFVHSTEGLPSTLSYTITTDGNLSPLECGLVYRVQISSVGLAGESTPDEASIIVGTVPSAPENLQITQSIPNDKLVLAWDPPSDDGCLPVRSYILAIDGTDQTGLTITADMSEVEIDISADGAYGKTMVLTLRAVNDKDEGVVSEGLSAVVGSVPDAPSSLTLVSRPSRSSLAVSWTADVQITNNQFTTAYRVYRVNTGGDDIKLFDTEDASLTTKATLVGLTTGDTYELVVRAVNIWGESTNSNTLTVKIGVKPSQPAVPVLKSTTSTSLTLTILPSSDNGGVPITHYEVSYDVGQTGTFVDETVTDLSSLEWQKTGLPTSALVDIKVAAVNSILKSDYSRLVTYVVAGVPSTPGQPTLFGAPVEQANSTVAATIEWTASSNQGSAITGYTLYYKRSQSSEGYKVVYKGIGRPDILRYTVTGLKRSVQYSFKVTATNRAGESLASPVLQIIAAGVPSVPTNVEVVETSAGSITVNWNAPESDGGLYLTGYRVYFKQTSAASFGAPVSTQATTATLALTADLEYAIHIVAVNQVGDSQPSTTVYAYASDVPTLLSAPTLIYRKSGLVKIEWSAPTSTLVIRGYQVFANKGDGSYPSELVYNGESVPSRRHATITGLKTGNEYSFTFVAINAAGKSEPSPILTVTVGDVPEPPAKPPKLTSSTSSSIAFSWEASPQSYDIPITAYHVYQDGVKIATVGATVYDYTVSSGLTAGSSYTFSVSAESSIGEGSQSHSKTFFAVDTPQKPTLTVTGATRDTCTVKWTEVTPPANTVIQGYVIVVSEGSSSWIAYNGEHNPSVLNTVVEGLFARRYYRIKGYAINKAGKGVESDEVT